MADHTKKTTFAAFVNIDKSDKYWIDGHWEFSDDCPSLFKFNTKEEKKLVQDVAQSYLDNWGCKALELVVFEVKSRHEVKLQKRTEAEKEEYRKKLQQESIKIRELAEAPVDVPVIEKSPLEVVEPDAPKKRGRKPKDATI